MNMLQSIRQQIIDTKNKLKTLRVNGSLDDMGSIRSKRIELKEDLEILAEAETDERDRLVAEEKKQNSKKRRAALTALATKSEKLVLKHSDLTERATNVINELVCLLIEREQVFTQKSTGLDAPVFNELFSVDERSDLVYEMNRSAIRVYKGDFTVTFYDAIDKQTEGESSSNLKHTLRELFTLPHSHNTAIKGANSLLVKAAKAMQFKPVPEPEPETKTDVITVKKQIGIHQAIDPRI